MFDSTAFETSSVRTTSRDRRRQLASREACRSASTGAVTLEVVALVVIAALLIAGAFMSRGPIVDSPELSGRIKVRAGDSLWTVAAQHPVEGMSTAQLVDLLANANGLHGRGVRPGQTIVVPEADLNERLASR